MRGPSWRRTGDEGRRGRGDAGQFRDAGRGGRGREKGGNNASFDSPLLACEDTTEVSAAMSQVPSDSAAQAFGWASCAGPGVEKKSWRNGRLRPSGRSTCGHC